MRKTPFAKALPFFAWNRCGEISRFASVMRTRAAFLWRRYDEGRVSYKGASGFAIGFLTAHLGAVVKLVYLAVSLMHESIRVS